MPTVRKRGDAWRVEVCCRGVRESASFDRKADALAWGVKREAEIRAGRAAPVAMNLHAAFDDYAKLVSPKHKGRRWEEIRLSAFKRSLPDGPLAALTAADVARWRDKRLKAVSAASVRREMALLHSVLEVARLEWGAIPANPMADVRRPPPARPRDRVIADAERDAIVAALGLAEGVPVVTQSQEIAVAFLIALEAAMRSSELLGLEWDRVDLSRRVATLLDSKNGDTREVPLSARAAELFRLLPSAVDMVGPVFRVGPATRDALFRKARDRAGLSGFTFHDSRATALTLLAEKLDILELARMVGHRDPRSLMIYYRKTAAQIAQKLD